MCFELEDVAGQFLENGLLLPVKMEMVLFGTKVQHKRLPQQAARDSNAVSVMQFCNSQAP